PSTPYTTLVRSRWPVSPSADTCPRGLLHWLRSLPFQQHQMSHLPFANQSKAKQSCSYPLYFAPILWMYFKVLFVNFGTGTAITRPIKKLCSHRSLRIRLPLVEVFYVAE